MTSPVEQSKDRDTCRKLISLGYARSNRVRLYGQELELVSDPFPHREGGIAIEVAENRDSVSRTIKLPLSVVQVANQAENGLPDKDFNKKKGTNSGEWVLHCLAVRSRR